MAAGKTSWPNAGLFRRSWAISVRMALVTKAGGILLGDCSPRTGIPLQKRGIEALFGKMSAEDFKQDLMRAVAAGNWLLSPTSQPRCCTSSHIAFGRGRNWDEQLSGLAAVALPDTSSALLPRNARATAPSSVRWQPSGSGPRECLLNRRTTPAHAIWLSVNGAKGSGQTSIMS